ncbi:uncharacterized protein [Apostichopus japonicus]|uniref:uncharacterized protein n=1 Tax=Stichopus japonicus TaxID=307972 RepID=UPI003AB79F59
MEGSQLVEEGQKRYSEAVGAGSAIGIPDIDYMDRSSIWDCTPAFAGSNILGASSSSNHGSHSMAHPFQYRRFQENLNPFSISATHPLTDPGFVTNPAVADNRHVGFSMATNPVTEPDLLVQETRRDSSENNLTSISEPDFQGLATFSNTIPKTSPGDKDKTDLDQGSDTSSPTRRKRRPYSKLQLLHLEREFQLCMYPCRERRVWLSQVLNLTERQVKIWFQNRRTKLKRTMEREKRENEQMQRDMASLAMKFYSAQ